MSIQAVAWALEQDLPARPKLVLVSIANHADHTNGYCWLKAKTIAAESACTPRSVFRFIGGLVRNGYIRRAPRKGADGKQRANDYWILFNREPAEWDWGKHLDDEADDGADDQGADDQTEAQDAVEPGEILSHGDAVDNSAPQAVEKHALSSGPYDNGVTPQCIAEPSKTKPEEKRARASLGGPPRGYHPPPPDEPSPQAAVADQKSKQIFVYAGTDAWNSWARHRQRVTGNNIGYPTTTRVFQGKTQYGWYFPSLYPPTAAEQLASAPSRESTGPPST